MADVRILSATHCMCIEIFHHSVAMNISSNLILKLFRFLLFLAKLLEKFIQPVKYVVLEPLPIFLE